MLALATAGLAALAGCDRAGPAASDGAAAARPVLAVSVFPVADLVGRVAGERWEVVTLLPPGRTPHEFALRPAEAAQLVRARGVVIVGERLDDWAGRAARGMAPDAWVLTLTEELGLPQAAAGTEPAEHPELPVHADDADRNGQHRPHDHDHEHAAGDDPHIWLDPILAGRIVERVARTLIERDPAGREAYERNLAALREQLRQLDAEYREGVGGCRTKALVVFHPGYAHLARRYGLEQVAISGAGGTSVGSVEDVVERIRREGIPAVYREPQYESKWVDLVSRRSGAKVLVLDPLGQPERAGYGDYFAMMRSNLAALRKGLCGGS